MKAPQLGLAAGLLSLFCVAHAAGLPALQHDPFARPSLVAIAAPAPGVSAPAEPPWQPVLSAVLVAGNKSLANVDGFVVQVGQEINGYRLVEVSETGAVLVNKKQRLTLKMMTPTRAP